MKTFLEKCKQFFDNYLAIVLFAFGILTIINYSTNYLSQNTVAGITYRIIVGSLFIIFILLHFASRKKEVDFKVALLCGFYLVGQILAISISPSIYGIEIPTIQTLLAIGQVFFVTITTIIYLQIIKEYDPKSETLSLLFVLFTTFGLFLTVFTYITQYEDIYNTFNAEYGWNYDVTSIFVTKTTYGFVLMIVSIFTIVYIEKRKKYVLYFLPVYYLINMFISRSKTSLFVTSLLLLAILIYHTIITWNKHKKIWITFYIVSACALLLFSIFLFIDSLRPSFLDRLHYYFANVIYYDGIVVMEDRIRKWGNLFVNITNPFSIIFGLGERISKTIVTLFKGASDGDSVYIYNYSSGGILKTVLYIALVIIALKYYLNAVKEKRELSLIAFFCSTVILIAGLTEDDSIVGLSGNGILTGMAFFLPHIFLNKCTSETITK